MGKTTSNLLAKFNLDSSQVHTFKGIPTPSSGLLVASFPLIMHYNSQTLGIGNIIMNKWFLYGTTLLISYLMLSNVPIMSMKFTDRTLKTNMPKIILASIAVISAIFLQWAAVPIIFIAYILLSLVYKNRL